MIRSRKVEEMNIDLVKSFSNDTLLLEESRKSRLTREDKGKLMRLGFTDLCNYYESKDLPVFLEKQYIK